MNVEQLVKDLEGMRVALVEDKEAKLGQGW